jgi:hypothetical protein
VIHLGQQGEELGRKKYSDLVDMVYKFADIESKKDTAEVKNYKYAVSQGFEGSFVDFKDLAETTKWKDYEKAKETGYEGPFHEWMLEMAKAGAINLGEFTERKEIGEEVERKSLLKSPKFRTDVEKVVKENRRFEYESSDNPEETKKRFVWEEMDKQVRTSYPDVTFGKDTETGIVGWYSKDGELIASWQ